MLLFQEAGEAFAVAAERALGYAEGGLFAVSAGSWRIFRLVRWVLQWLLMTVFMTYAGSAFQLFDVPAGAFLVYARLGWFAHIAAVAALVLTAVINAVVPAPKKEKKDAVAAKKSK